ncbi:MAG: hypothetical protein WED04_10395 [Promethearchaeati archaeon SRVP18_Atabeyarchaeia-1]
MEPIINKTTSKHPEWNESYYFAFYSKEHKLGGVSRIGFKPNKPESMTFFFLFLPDGSAAGYHLTNKAKEYSRILQVGGMAHLPQGNEVWKYEFKGNMILVKNPENLPKAREQPEIISGTPKVEMEFTFNPINEPYEYAKHMTPESLELGRKAGDRHWEQIARVNGKLIVDEKTYEVKDMIGQRDHTYGIRDWTGVGDWLYYVVWFNEGLAINPAAIVADDGRMSTGGFLFKDGKNIPLKTIKIRDQRFREDGVFPVSSELEIVDESGKKHVLKARVGPIVPVPFQDKDGKQSILIQSFGNFELDGIKGGYGTFETLRKAKRIWGGKEEG